MKNLTRILLLMLALVLCCVLVVACDDKPDSEKPDAGTPSTETPPAPETPPSTAKDITGVTFEGRTVDFNGAAHTLLLTGTLPEGVSVSYTGNSATDVGTYNATAVLSGEGYNTLTLTATLKINPIAMTGITFTGNTFAYDGAPHSISLAGTLPEGASVTYVGGQNANSAQAAGEYTITATVTHKNYVTFTATATLTITPLPMEGLSFEGDSFEFDGFAHTIAITGLTPTGAQISYTGGEDGRNGATNPGTYTVTVTVTCPNYVTFTATATLKITSKEEALTLVFVDGEIYFQNPLHKNYLYTLDGVTAVRVSRDTPTAMVQVGDMIYYLSKSLLSSGIYRLDPATGKSTCLLEVTADTLITDGTNLYYNVNSILKSEQNGIYKIAIADLENDNADPTPTRLCTHKAGSMTLVGNVIYFQNKTEGNKLYAISTSSRNATPVLIYDYKVEELISEGQTIYFVRNKILGDAIFSIDVSGSLYSAINNESNRLTKIAASKGKGLTIVGEYIYFINTDLATSTIFGDGIYRANKNGSGLLESVYEYLSGSIKVVDGATDSIYSLTSDGEYLYYYRTSTKHLYCFDLDNEIETDLMAGFVPPVENDAIVTMNSKTVLYGGEIYYINMRDGGKLYKYSPATETDVRITQYEVTDFAIYDGMLYYTTVRLLVNYDLYRMSLTTGMPERISTEKCLNLSFVGDKIYYNSFSGSNTFNSMSLDGTNVTVLFDGKGVNDNDTVVYDGYVYFVANDQLYRHALSSGETTLVNKNLKPLEYLIHDGKILMMNCDGLKNHAVLYDIASNTIHDLADLGYSLASDDIRGLFVYNDEFYFYRNVAIGSSKKGLYRVVEEGGEYTAVLIDTFDGYYLSDSVLVGDDLYFLNVWRVKDSLPNNPTGTDTAKLCVLNLTTKVITKLN